MAQTYNEFILKNITDDEVTRVIKRVRPFALADDDKPYWVKIDSPSHGYYFNTAFLWNGVKKVEPVPDTLREVARFTSYHTFGAPVFFKPSLAECAAQIKAYLETHSVEPTAFEVLSPVSGDYLAFLTKNGKMTDDQYHYDIVESLHKATIVLYKV